MPSKDNGTYTSLDLQSVNSSITKTVTFLKKKLPQLNNHKATVIFLGEEHRNAIDVGVSRAILLDPPVFINGSTRVILERGLIYLTAPGTDERTEPTRDLGPVARNAVLAEMIQDAIENHNKSIVYVACGADHAKPIFTALNKKLAVNFGFVNKPSSTD